GRPEAVERFVHGTTVATNAVLEQKGAVTAILATDGFEDVLELGRQKRARMYDLDMDPETPTFLAPRRRRGVGPRAPGPARTRAAGRWWRSTRTRCARRWRGCATRACRRSRSATCSHSSIPSTSGARAS